MDGRRHEATNYKHLVQSGLTVTLQRRLACGGAPAVASAATGSEGKVLMNMFPPTRKTHKLRWSSQLKQKLKIRENLEESANISVESA